MSTSHLATLRSLDQHEFLALVSHHRKWLTDHQAAAYLDIEKRSLDLWRARGLGPKFRRMRDGIRYHVNDLDNFLMQVEQ